MQVDLYTHTPFNGPLSGTTRVSRYQKGKTNLDFTGARDSEWQWNPLGHMQVCTSHQTDNHASTPPLDPTKLTCIMTVKWWLVGWSLAPEYTFSSSFQACLIHLCDLYWHCIMFLLGLLN